MFTSKELHEKIVQLNETEDPAMPESSRVIVRAARSLQIALLAVAFQLAVANERK